MATNKEPKQMDPKLVVKVRFRLSKIEDEQQEEASSGAIHQVAVTPYHRRREKGTDRGL
jgi:hypothetical protein